MSCAAMNVMNTISLIKLGGLIPKKSSYRYFECKFVLNVEMVGW